MTYPMHSPAIILDAYHSGRDFSAEEANELREEYLSILDGNCSDRKKEHFLLKNLVRPIMKSFNALTDTHAFIEVSTPSRHFEVTSEMFAIGRLAMCKVQDPWFDETISRLQCYVLNTPLGLLVVDAWSVCGTYVTQRDGRGKLPKSTPESGRKPFLMPHGESFLLHIGDRARGSDVRITSTPYVPSSSSECSNESCDSLDMGRSGYDRYDGYDETTRSGRGQFDSNSGASDLHSGCQAPPSPPRDGSTHADVPASSHAIGGLNCQKIIEFVTATAVPLAMAIFKNSKEGDNAEEGGKTDSKGIKLHFAGLTLEVDAGEFHWSTIAVLLMAWLLLGALWTRRGSQQREADPVVGQRDVKGLGKVDLHRGPMGGVYYVNQSGRKMYV
ncbi:unnamed protein product [Effrenium voratum]|nr:unnamed protein product [Effrenium voratum]CAJ1460728.1 unnamed protein product [Effrenium voratum]